MAGVINSWNKAKPAGTDYIDASDEFLRDNWAAIEVMVGSPTINLVVQQTSATTVTITADRTALFNAAAPPLCYAARSVSLTAAITASGANGLDAGSEAANTWYFIWVIYDPASDTVASLLSTSATSPTMPSGYTFKRLVGVARNDGSSNFVPFIQRGNRVSYKAAQEILTAGTATTYTQIAMAVYLPSITKRAFGYAYPRNTTNNEYTLIYLADDSSGNYATFVGGICRTIQNYTACYWEIELVADIDVCYKVAVAAGTGSVTIGLTGFYVEI